MQTSDLQISRIGPESDLLLRNLFEHYLHDMAEWFGFDTEPDGSYSFDTSTVWDGGYDAYLAKLGDSIAGFALVGSATEWLDDADAHDVDEFFVIRRFRRQGVAGRFAHFLWDERPGPWLVRVLEANLPAVPFWRSTISSYTVASYEEERRVINGRPWLFFQFQV